METCHIPVFLKSASVSVYQGECDRVSAEPDGGDGGSLRAAEGGTEEEGGRV